MPEIKLGYLALVAFLAIGAILYVAQQQGVPIFQAPVTVYQGEGEAAGAAAGAGAGATATKVGSYPIKTVTLELKDALNKKAGVANITVEVIPIKGTESKAELIKLASSPMRRKVDEAVTDENGVATFDSGRIFTGKPYLYSIRGDSTVYDKLVVYTIEAPEGLTAPLDYYPIEEPVYVYKVGSFVNISETGNTITISLAGLSGPQYTEFDIKIGEAEAGKVLKNPVLVLKTDETNKIPAGGIISLYIVKKSGTDVIPSEIASQNLVDWIDTAPIALKGSLTEDEDVYMTVADTGVYTVKMTFDADVVKPGHKLRIILDDLGDYGGQDVTTRDTKAAPQILTIEFTS